MRGQDLSAPSLLFILLIEAAAAAVPLSGRFTFFSLLAGLTGLFLFMFRGKCPALTAHCVFGLGHFPSVVKFGRPVIPPFVSLWCCDHFIFYLYLRV